MEDWTDLVRERRFDDAEPLMLAATAEPDGYGGETITRAEFYEEWGDHLRPNPSAEEKYRQSWACWARFASWATSGGEGTARMMDVNRVLEKIDALMAED